jgi:hypothetical protein
MLVIVFEVPLLLGRNRRFTLTVDSTVRDSHVRDVPNNHENRELKVLLYQG